MNTWIVVTGLALQLSTPAAAGQGAPACGEGLRTADSGFRYRVEAGDFVRDSGRRPWLRALTEPVVTEVAPGGPAAERLRLGDAIVAVGDHLVTTYEGSRSLAQPSPGKPLLLTVRRNGRHRIVTIVPRTACLEVDDRAPAERGGAGGGWLGMALRCDGCRYEMTTGAWRFDSPPMVSDLAPASPAALHLRVGDRLVAVDGADVTSPEGARRLATVAPGQRITLRVERGGKQVVVDVIATVRPMSERRPRV